jgi:tRNA nucleotidyltransferase (CCA-adding enzyme)
MKTMDADGVAHFKGHPEKSSELANEILHRLKFDNDTIRKVTKLVRYHDHRMSVTPAHVRRAVHEIGEDLFPLYLEVRRADVAAQSMYQRKEKVADIDGVEKLYHEIMERKECVSLKTLAVTGKDLIAAGMKPGKEIGQMLEHFLDLVLEHPELNQKEELLKRIEL